jgi:formamidopyrimidine-DNA glycosylase
MPELPEVETVMRGLESVITGAKITAVDQRRKDLRVPFPDKLADRLVGRKILSLKRRAKYILVNLDNSEILIIHLGMSGRVSIIPKGEEVKLEKHDHLVLTFQNGVTITYNDPRRFGMILLIDEKEFETHKNFAHLGPEPLGNDFSAPILLARLKGKNTSIKQALLDQRVVVGVGNIYACEALFLAGINPLKKARLVKGEKMELLVKAIRDVLMRAIKAGGSTLKDYRHADGQLGYFQHNFTVYNQEGERCPTCDCDIAKTNGIKRIMQAGRSTFYCSKKQK